MLSRPLIQYLIQSEHSIICSVCLNLTVSNEEGGCSESEILPGGRNTEAENFSTAIVGKRIWSNMEDQK